MALPGGSVIAPLLPPGRGRGLGAGPGTLGLAGASAFAPCVGGIVATHAGGHWKKPAKHIGPIGVLSKESYAIALDEQIAGARDAKARQLAFDGAPDPNNPFAALGPLAAGRDDRATRQASYAAALDNQIQERNAARRALSTPEMLTHATNAPSAAVKPMKGKPPTMPSKEAYAAALQEQIAASEAQRSAAAVKTPPPAVENASDQRSGRRHFNGPQKPPHPELYASDLQAQVRVRSEQREALRRASLEEDEARLAQVPPSPFAGGGAVKRGKRHESVMLPDSKEDYRRFLQEQMAGRDAQRASEAFHVQEPVDTSLALQSPQADKGRGRRVILDKAALSKSQYSAALQKQIATRDALQSEAGAELESASFVKSPWNAAPKSGPGSVSSRGRRHDGHQQMEPLSKLELGSVLREQMAERSAARAADIARAREGGDGLPTPRGLHDMVVPSGGDTPRKGRRHVAHPEPVSKQEYAAYLHEQMSEGTARPGQRQRSASSPARTLIPRQGYDDEAPRIAGGEASRIAGGTEDALERLLGEHALGSACN